jgi:hypothetical protein
MEIQFAGALNKEDYLSLSKLTARPIVRKGEQFTFDLWLLLVFVGAIMVSIGVWQFIAAQERVNIVWFLPLMLGFLAFAIGFKLRSAPHKAWEQHESLRIIREGNITPEAVEIRTSQGQWRVLWTDLTGYGEYRDIIALFQGPSAPIPFPRHFFKSDEDWDAFQTMTTDRLEATHRVASVELSRTLVLILILIAIVVLVTNAATGLSDR